MTVPKKRKKLEPAKDKKKTVQKKQPRKSTKASAPRKAASKARQLDEAFEIIEHIEEGKETGKPLKASDSNSRPDVENGAKNGVENSSGKSSDRLGFRWNISLDAVMPDDSEPAVDHKNAEKKPVNPRQSTVFDVGFTIPFFWDWPVFGELTRKFFQNISGYNKKDLF